MSQAAESIRPIHYMGNKSRFLDAIESEVSAITDPGALVCDLFAGSGVVSRRLATRRPVVSSDIQAYSKILVSALTAPTSYSKERLSTLLAVARAWMARNEPGLQSLLRFEDSAIARAGDNPHDLAEIVESGPIATLRQEDGELHRAKAKACSSIDPDESRLFWHYGGVYFSYRQALELDALHYAIRREGTVGRDETAVAALLGAASDSVSTVGNHFAQPVQPRSSSGSLKHSWVSSVVRARSVSPTSVFAQKVWNYSRLQPTEYTCEARIQDYREALSSLPLETGAIYADPPYTRDHYSRFYHVLETIALDDDPGISRAQGSSDPSRGLYRVDRHQSPFSIRTKVRGAFEELFAHSKRLDAPMVLSYSPMSEGTKARPQTRLVAIEDLIDIASGYFRSIRVVGIESSYHSRFNKAELNAASDGSAEVLIVGSN